MRAYKFLEAGTVGRFSGLSWPPAGAWVSACAPVEQCRSGIHACTADGLLDWLDDELWEIELGDPVDRGPAGLVARRGRLVRRVDAWDDDVAASLVDSCVRSVHAHVGAALYRIGAAETARELAAAESVADLVLVAAGADEPGSTLAAFVIDCVLLASGGRPDEAPGEGTAPPVAAIAANVAYVAAHVAGRAAGDAGYDRGFAAERERQLAWLHERLAI